MTSTIKVNNIQNQCGTAYIQRCGTTITLGTSGDNITLACGATQTGFGRTGTVDWDTTAKTASFTAVSGNGYFVNTTSGAITVTLPASPSGGDIVSVSDYAKTFSTNNCTIARNSSNIDGSALDLILNTTGVAVTLVYVDATKGWKPVNSNEISSGPKFVAATGGTITTCGDYKIHTFTGPGCFSVTCAGNAGGSNTVDYLVVAGGGGGSAIGTAGAGGGAGGFRESCGGASGCYTASPLKKTCGALPVTAQDYPIAVGGGGSSSSGSNSSFSTITSAGGGRGGWADNVGGSTGGSGGGGGSSSSPVTPGTGVGGAGNTPPVSPPQGSPGGNGGLAYGGNGGGGGATDPGSNGSNSPPQGGNNSGGAGGDGATTNISASPVTYAGGGGGGARDSYGTPASGGAGGPGGGGAGGPSGSNGSAATANTGGGGGGAGENSSAANGGSGIVIIRYKYQ